MNGGSVPFEVTAGEVGRLRQLGLNWTKVSEYLGTSTKTMRKWRSNNDYQVELREYFGASSAIFVSFRAVESTKFSALFSYLNTACFFSTVNDSDFQ